MRTVILAAVIALASAPVFAQQTGKQHKQEESPQLTAMSKQKLRATLQEAGFKQINIVDAAYIVRAQTENGDNVVMYIDPPALTQDHSETSEPSNPDGTFKTDSIRRAREDSQQN